MIRTSDLILRAILDNKKPKYNSLWDFCIKNDIDYEQFRKAFKNNSLKAKHIDIIARILKKDLTPFKQII